MSDAEREAWDLCEKEGWNPDIVGKLAKALQRVSRIGRKQGLIWAAQFSEGHKCTQENPEKCANKLVGDQLANVFREEAKKE